MGCKELAAYLIYSYCGCSLNSNPSSIKWVLNEYHLNAALDQSFYTKSFLTTWGGGGGLIAE